MQKNYFDEIRLLIELFERDKEPKVVQFHSKLIKAHNRLFNSRVTARFITDKNLKEYFRFHNYGVYFGVGDDDFIENVYIYSHDKSFHNDLIEAYQELYTDIIQNYDIGFWNKIRYNSINFFIMFKTFAKDNPLSTFLLTANIIVTIILFVVVTIQWGLFGFLMTLLIMLLVFYVLMMQFDRYL
jgi:hypothetical protein